MLPPPPRVKIHDTHYDYFHGEVSHIDYFPFCDTVYFDWLLCHAMHVQQTTYAQLKKGIRQHKVSFYSIMRSSVVDKYNQSFI